LSGFNEFDRKLKKIVNTNEAPKAVGPYSQATLFEDLVFLSGQIALNPSTGNLEGTNIEEQTKQVMHNISAVLRASGSDLDRVLKCTVYLSDLEEFQSFNKVYSAFFKDNPPARSTIQAAKLPRNAKVEIDVIAAKKNEVVS